MSRRKRRKKRRQQGDTSDSDGPPPEVGDRRALEKSLADMGRLLSEKDFGSIDEINAFLHANLASGELPSPTRELTPLEQAQDIMYEAWDATSSTKRARLARKALSISSDCADAYVLLAEEAAKNVKEARRRYEQGVEAGERALGPEAFEENVGHFWGILETRPYMRARAGLASCLWMMGEKQQAITHYQDMLRLNPGDNQGIRHVLVSLLLETGDDEATSELLEQYEGDGTAVWLYSRALWLFRREETREAATAQLEEAISFNPFVPPYLLGQKKLPRQLPPYMGFGDEKEAIHYAVDAQAIWQQDRDALAWLRETVARIDSDK